MGRLGGILFVIAVMLVAAGAFCFRVPQLDLRPMHTDEAVHTVKAGILLETGVYTYDPNEYHGPTIYYAALPFIRFSGARTLADTSEWMFRIVPVLFGTGLILLLLGIGSGLGRWEAVCAGILTAVSPAMVFYSRYYIQEMLLVFFTFGAIVAGWRYSQAKHWGWALAAGACLGLMHATKETAVLAYAAMGGALVLTFLWTRMIDGETLPWRESVKPWHAALAALAWIVVVTTVLSGFFTHPRGALDAFLTFLNYVRRADGAGIHDHPWNYYFDILLGLRREPGPHWHEKLIVLMAAIGALVALSKATLPGVDKALVRFLTFYTALLAIVYSVIPYKTPWCMLGFLHGMILLAGVAAVFVLRRSPNLPAKSILAAVLIVATAQLGMKAYDASFKYPADSRNPYVYGHTSTDFMRLVKRIDAIARVAPEGRDLLIKIVTPDAWPLPWYLRAYPRVGYWPSPIDDPDAPIVITSQDLEPEVQPRLHGTYQTELYGLRPEVLIAVFIRQDLWDAFIKSQS